MGQSAAEKTRGSPERYEAIETAPGPPEGVWRSPNRSSRNQSWGVAPISGRQAGPQLEYHDTTAGDIRRATIVAAYTPLARGRDGARAAGHALDLGASRDVQ